MKIQYDSSCKLWYIVGKQMLNDMKLHKVIIAKFDKHCDALKFIEESDEK